jgi:aminopeptidase YwaD
MSRIKFLLPLACLAACTAGKKIVQNEPGITNDLKHSVYYLADDRLEGRRTGTNGEKLAMVFIRDQFVKAGLQPKGDSGYFQSFPVKNEKRIGHNVIGYMDNGAATTVILGAHYDHLGYGEDSNSRSTSKIPEIHNGADDNASGTAAVMELAKLLKNSKAKNNNYLFIAFSGEELGLFGSKYFTEHPTINLSNVDYMVNMDMVGRLNDSTHVLTIGGYGTSPVWNDIFADPNSPVVKESPFIYKFDSSGTGPSDHTSFYRKDIPVLFYFTGLHADYHKPSDDADKINYKGEYEVVENILQVIGMLDARPRLAFLKTRETQSASSARFSVTMGIMPDYTFAGAGVRADGVSDGKPASKAGLKAGDIILQLGDYPTPSMEQYMQTLGKFKKGDKTTVKFKRGDEIMTAPVEF